MLSQTGCNLDGAAVWAQEACDGGDGRWTINGDGASGTDTCVASAALAASADVASVRCCADVFGPSCTHRPTPVPTVKPTTMVPTPVPSELEVERVPECSVSRCDDLGWFNYDAFGSSEVCGESEFVTGQCSGLLDLKDARRFCQAGGARLCSLEELLDDEARETGCNYDVERVWSSTAVADPAANCSAYDPAGGDEEGFWTAWGSTASGTEPECRLWTDTAYVRCCAARHHCTP